MLGGPMPKPTDEQLEALEHFKSGATPEDHRVCWRWQDYDVGTARPLTRRPAAPIWPSTVHRERSVGTISAINRLSYDSLDGVASGESCAPVLQRQNE